jgi:membrane protein implicated in regulation of membrane protease activity
MGTLFLICAMLGGTVLVLQLLLGLVGLGFETADLHLEGKDGFFKEGAHASDALNLLSARALAAGFAFFGIGGLVTLSAGLGPLLALPAALLTSAGAAVGTAVLMRGLTRLEDDGTVRIERAIGESGTVYLRIPGHRAGAGKVLLTLQNRTVECRAVTSLDELPTGTPIIVVDILGPDTVEVAPAPTLGGLLNAST